MSILTKAKGDIGQCEDFWELDMASSEEEVNESKEQPLPEVQSPSMQERPVLSITDLDDSSKKHKSAVLEIQSDTPVV